MKRYSLATQLVSRPGTIVSLGAPTSRVITHRETIDVNAVVRDIIDSTKVRADDLARDFWLERDNKMTAANVGPIRVPFDTIWIEWQNPPEYVTDKGELVPNRTTDAGVLMRNYTLEEWEPFEAERNEALERAGIPKQESRRRFEELGVEVINYATHFERWKERNLIAHAGSVAYGLSRSGTYVAHAGSTPLIDPRITRKAKEDGNDITHMLTGATETGIWPALRALGIMNCKNVDIRLVENPQSRGKKSRRDLPDYDFHTIRLPGVTYQRDGRPAAGSDAILRQHMVRGHFKTYTPEKPLLGRHSGTFWWGWQARGSQDKGLVEHDYSVSAPE